MSMNISACLLRVLGLSCAVLALSCMSVAGAAFAQGGPPQLPVNQVQEDNPPATGQSEDNGDVPPVAPPVSTEMPAPAATDVSTTDTVNALPAAANAGLSREEQLEAERMAEKELKGKAPFQDSFLFTAQAKTNVNRAVRGICVRMGEEGGPAQRRVLKLAGLLYQAPGQWIIWLNGKRVTPDRLLPEIVDIDVNMSSVYLEWFDIGLNKVISITLRPHQVYDIETGILLPG